jgi:hypothetical protein
MAELPADLLVHDLRATWSRETGGSDGIRGGAQCMRAHVTDRHGLAGGSGSSRRRGSLHLIGRHAPDEASANLLCRVELSSGERSSASDGGARPIVNWSLGLKKAENPLCTIRGPCGDTASFGLAERLRRCHYRSLQMPTTSCRQLLTREGWQFSAAPYYGPFIDRPPSTRKY